MLTDFELFSVIRNLISNFQQTTSPLGTFAYKEEKNPQQVYKNLSTSWRLFYKSDANISA